MFIVSDIINDDIMYVDTNCNLSRAILFAFSAIGGKNIIF